MKGDTSKKLTKSMVTVAVLAVCLCVTTFALVWAMVSVDGNLFHTGVVKINLNDKKPVIEEHEFLFEPGMTVRKEFFVENQSTWDVYYKLYFEEIEGGLADILEVTINTENKVLYAGKMSELTKENAGAADDILRLHEHRKFAISFHFPEQAGNSGQNQELTFSIKADAVQTKNNPNMLFD